MKKLILLTAFSLFGLRSNTGNPPANCQAGDGNLDSKLSFEKAGHQIQNAKFYSFSAGMNFDPVQCSFQN